MSDTPRTDKQVAKHRLLGGGPLELDGPFADFARELERENAALHDALKIGELPHPMWSKDDLCFQYQQALAERDEETEMRKELERENAALREVLNRWKEICEMGLPDVVMPSLKLALFELWDATDTAINAARAKEGGAK